MSYAVRNTIILLVTLFLIIGLGYGYSKFYLESKLQNYELDLANKKNDLNSKQSINNQFEELSATYEKALAVINNYDKILYPSNKPDKVFDFLNKINEDGGNRIFFDYVFNDSIPDNQYGVIESSVSGFGNYSSLVSFINKIENSQLLNKVSNVTISPARTDDGVNDVNFNLTLNSYYQKSQLFDSTKTTLIVKEKEGVSTYNPLFPLIQNTLPANEDGLVNVEGTRIVGITANRVFVIGQEGKVISLKVGDKVYLGYLSSLDLKNKRATFNLNKGGIQEVITLEVVRK